MMLCEGDACQWVELEWDGDRREYRFRNTGCRAVRVALKSLAGWTRFTLDPGEVKLVGVVGFDYPYSANFADS